MTTAVFDPWEAYGRFHRRCGALVLPPRTLASLAEEFVALKRMLGHRYLRQEKLLADALGFLGDRGVRFPGEVSPAALGAYAAAHPCVAPRTWAGIVDCLSVFFDHLCALGWLQSNPCPLLRRPQRRHFRPYLYARAELVRLFSPESLRRTAAVRALVYRTIYGGALRRSEALRLRLRHFDAAEGTLTIVNTKFGKSRQVPLHPSVVQALGAFVETQRAAAGPDEPLFVNARGREIRPKRLEAGFGRDLERAGIAHRSVIEGNLRHGAPCLHSLRHSFAVHRLLQWYREGADVEAKLPLLSTFLGHSHIRNTQTYLTITRALLEEGRQRFAARWEKEFRPQP